MAKVNFTKVEKSFDRAVQKLLIDELADLAAIANVIQDPEKNIDKPGIIDMIERFQKQLKRIKKQDTALFALLALSADEEKRLNLPPAEFSTQDWLDLKALKLRIDELKKKLYGEEKIEEEHQEQVSKERKRHVNKRFNIREGWLPLK